MIKLTIALIALVVFGGVLICICTMVMEGVKERRLRKAWINYIMEMESWESYSFFLKYHDRKAWLKYIAKNEESK